MPAARTDAELLRIVSAVRQHGGSHVTAAKTLGCSRSNVSFALAKAKRRWPNGAPTTALTPFGAPTSQPEAVAPPAPIDDIQDRRDRNTLQGMSKRLVETQKRLIAVEDERDTLLRLGATRLAPLPARPKSATLQKKTRMVPILFSSDFQTGEVIKADEIDGLNAYDMDVFAERYDRLIGSTIDIADHHTGASEFPGVYYLRGGDAISGGIHPELKDTDDLSSIPAVKWLLRHEREGIRRLRERFGRVKVISIPGNHGRTTFKPRAKGYVEHSYETLLAWWLASTFEQDPAVEFWAPKSGDAYFEVEGWNFLLAHGDRMGSRGGAGFVGPAATIARGHQKLHQTWAASGKVIDVILTGHLHTSLKLQRGYANGSLAGYGEFARDIQALPDAAKQWLLFAHAKRCVAQAFEVQCSERPKRTIITDFAE